jgi:hypothetical protein
MNARETPHFPDGATVNPATIVAPATGTIVLAIGAICELWCRWLKYEPKVQSRTNRFMLAADRRFRAQNTSVIMRRARERRLSRMTRV